MSRQVNWDYTVGSHPTERALAIEDAHSEALRMVRFFQGRGSSIDATLARLAEAFETVELLQALR